MAALTLTVNDKAHILGTATDLIDGSAAITETPVDFISGDTLTITGLTKYDTLTLKTSGAAAGDVQLVGNEIQFHDGTSFVKVGTLNGGDGTDVTITFDSGTETVTDTVVEKILQNLTISADTSGTIVDDRTLTFTFGGSNTGSDTSTYSITGTANADTIIYSADALAFDPLAGNDILKVEVDTTVAANAIDMSATSFEVLNAAAHTTGLTITIGAANTDITTGSGIDTIEVSDVAHLDTNINTGTGIDTLEFTAAASVNFGTISGTLSNIEKIQLADAANSLSLSATDSFYEITGGSDVDVIDASARTVTTAILDGYSLKIATGAGNDVVVMSQGKDNIDLGADDNELKIKQSSDLTAEDVVTAGAGTADKITLDNAITTMNDVQFTQVTGFEELVVGTDATTLTLGDQVREAGIKTITGDAATGALSVDMTDMTADITGVTVTGSDNGLTVKVRAEDIEATDVFTGGTGADILEVATSGTITDAELAGVSAIETLNITATSGNVTLTIADSNDFTTIDSTSSTGNNTIDASAELDVTGGLTINTGGGDDTITTGATTTGVTLDAGNGDNTITLGTATNDVTAGSGDDIVNLVDGTDTLKLGSGDNIVKVTTYADFDSSDSISEDGTTTTSAGTNTLQFDVAVDDATATVESKLGGTNKIDIIKLGDDSTQIVTLGTNALASKVIEVDGSILTTGNDLTVDLTAMDPTSGTFTVKGGDGDDIVKIDSASLTSTTSLQLGIADTVDTLDMADVSTIVDADFTLSSGVDTITFAVDGAHDLTLGDLAIAAGVRTIDTSVTSTDGTTAQATASTIDLSDATVDADFKIYLGDGDDSITMKASHLTSNDYIVAGTDTVADTADVGTGSDTLTLTDGSNATIADSAFTNVSGIEKLVLGTGNNQTLIYGAEAKEAGITDIDGSGVGAGNKVTVDLTDATNMPLKITLSSGNDTVIMSDAGSTDGAYTIDLGDGDNLVQTVSASLTSGDKITGGSGVDTLEITDAATIIDDDFDKITNFEEIVLANGANTLTMGAKAKAAGVVTIDGSASASVLDITIEDSTFNIGAGTGDDILRVSDANLVNTTFDGVSGTDSVEITDSASLTDSDFANMLNIDTLKLKDFDGQTVTLGDASTIATNAINSGLATIDASGLSGVNSISVDISGMTKNMTVNTASGDDTITLGRANDTIDTGAGDDVIKVKSENFTSADTLDGGTHNGAGGILGDILEITTSTTAIADTHFDNVSGIETINLSSTSGVYDITLGETHAYTNGIREISIDDGVSANIDLTSITSGAIKITKSGTTGDVTVTTSTTNQADDFIFGSGADTVKIISANLTSADSYEFGAGADTLEVTDGATIVDADFTNITGLETIKVGDFGNSITLSDIAQTAGVNSIDLSNVITAGNAQTIDVKDMLNDQAFTITGGAGVETITMKAEHLTSADTITGGGSSDILEFTTEAVSKGDGDFANVSGVETLKLEGSALNQSLTLGTNALGSFETIDASAASGKVTLDLTSASDLTILGSSGTTEVTMDATYLTSADTITGNGTDDKIIFDTVATSVAVGAFSSVTGIEILEMQATTGVQDVTLGVGFTTVDASVTDSSVVIDGATTTGLNLATVTTGTGADTLKIEAADLDASDEFALGTGADTLEITTDASNTITDSDFANKTGIETLKLSADADGQVVTLANSAITTGIRTVDVSGVTASNATTVDLSTMTTEFESDGTTPIAMTVLGGSGADTIKMKANQLGSTDVLTGGLGDDILEFTTVADGVVDTAFTGVTGIETLEFADISGQSITLGTKALEDGSIGTIDASSLTGTNDIAITISDTASNHGLTITTGAGADTITMKAEDLTSADIIDMAGGVDTIALSSNGANTTVGVAAFTNVSNVEKLELLESGAYTQDVTLGAGFTTVDASVATDDVTIDATYNDDNVTNLDLSSVTTGSGDDTLKIEAEDLAATDSFNLGTGADTLEITTDATNSIADSDFTSKTGIETLKLGNFAGQSVAIGDNAVNAGIATIDLTNITTSANSATVDMSSLNQYKDMSVLGGAGVDTIKMKAEHLTSADTISGNGGTDILQFTTKVDNIADTAFTGVTGVETLEFADISGQSITLGTKALEDGDVTIIDADALTGTNSISITVSDTTSNHGLTITTGAGADTITMKAEDLTSADTIDMAGGVDTLSLSANGANTTIALSAFTNISNVEKLELLENGAYTQDITLGAGFTTVDASVATDDVTIDGATTTSLDLATVTTGAGDDVLKLENGDFTSADTIDLGAGADTIEIIDAGTIIDADFTNVDGVEKILLSKNAASQSVTLGDLSVTAGVNEIDFSAITNTTYAASVTLSAITNDSTTKITGGAGADSITMNASHLTSADELIGGDNIDTLTFADGDDLTDADFTNVSGIEKIVLANAAKSYELGDNALGGGVVTIDGSALSGNAVTIDMSGATGDTETTITTGDGADTVKMKSAYLTTSDTFDGDAGSDTLEFSDTVNLSTIDNFANVSNFEKITLLDTNAQSIALASGFTTLDASAATDTVNVYASLFSEDYVITTGSGDDSIKIAAASFDASDDIEGGSGTDTLQIDGALPTITDAKVAQITNVEVLKLTNTSDTASVTLAANAQTNGINKIDLSLTASVNTVDFSAMSSNMEFVGGTGADTVTAGTGDNTIDTGAGNDTVTIAAANLDANDVIDGGAGVDELILTGVTSTTTSFDNVSGFESIKLADGNNQEFILGADSDTNNLLKVDASAMTGGNSIVVDISGYQVGGVGVADLTDSDSFVYVGGAGDDTFKMQSDHLSQNDILSGGAGANDILEFTDVAIDSTTTSIFNNVSGFETLKLADVATDQRVTLKDATFTTITAAGNLSTNALTINGGNITGDVTITTVGGDDVITASKGVNTISSGAGDDTIKFNIGTFTADDILDGGDGTADTLEFIESTTVITDGLFANKTNIEKIVLSQNEANQSVTVGTNATATGIRAIDTTAVAQAVTVDAGSLGNQLTLDTAGGDDTVTLGTDVNTVNTGAGTDTIKIAASTLTSTDIIDGDAGTDILELTGVTNVSDSGFAQVSNVETLKLADDDGQSVTLGTAAKAAGIVTIDGSQLTTGHTATLDLTSFDQNTKIIGGAGNETVTLTATTLDGSDDINLGTGDDTIIFADSLSSSPDLSKVTGVETLELADGNNQLLTLVDTINSSLTVDATALVDVNKVTIDGSALGSATTTFNVTTSTGADTITLGSSTNTVSAGGGDDTIIISMDNLSDANVDTINGNIGTNTLELTGGGSSSDANLASVTNIATVELTSADKDYTLELAAANAGTNNILNIDGSALTTGTVTIDASTLGNEVVTFKGGDANDTFTIAGVQLTSADTIDGKTTTDSDTLIIKDGSSTATTINDSAFTNVTNMENLTFAESANHTLTAGDNFASSGISTIDASALANTKVFDMDGSSMTTDVDFDITGGAGNDIVTMNGNHLTSNDVIKLGTGNDTLELSDTATLTDTNFAATSTGIETLKFIENLAQDLTIGANVIASGIRTIDASALGSATADIDATAVSNNLTITTGGGNDTISLGSGDLTVDAGAGDDTVQIVGTELTRDDIIDGGADNTKDILEIITTQDNLVDADFTQVSNMEELLLSVDASQTLTLGDIFSGAGFSEIDGSTLTGVNTVTVDISSMGSDGDYTITGGAGNDVVKTLGAHITSGDKIDLGAGTSDTIQIASISTANTSISDNAFTNISGVETLQFLEYTNEVDYGDTMMTAGVETIDGSTISRGYSLDVDMTNMSTANTTAIGGYTLIGGDGNDNFVLRADQISSSDTIEGGVNDLDTDTLEFTTSVIFNDTSKFTNVTNIDVIKLADSSGQKIVLRDNLTEVLDGSALTGTNGIIVDGSTLTTDIEVKSGEGDDDIKLGSGDDKGSFGSGDDTLTIVTNNLDQNDVIDFGDGTDEIVLTTASDLGNDDFKNITNLEIITLGDFTNTLTLGDYAKASGLTKIDASGSTNATTIDMSIMSSNIGLEYLGGSGIDTITMNGLQFLSDDHIDGGAGVDIIELTDQSYVTDAAFTNVTNVETLKLADGTHNVTLGTLAEAAGIVTIDTSAVTNPLTIDLSGTTGNITITGRDGADVIVIGQGDNTVDTGLEDDIIKTTSENLTTDDVIDGGAGDDTLILTTAMNETTSAKFTQVTNVETLQLGAFNNQEITLRAGVNNFEVIDGSSLGTNSVTIDASAVNSNLEITTSAGSDTIQAGDTAALSYSVSSGSGNDLIEFDKSSVITSANDFIDGGDGDDVLSFTSTSDASVILDTWFGSHIKSIETIKFGDVDGSSLTLGSATLTSGVRTIDTTDVAAGKTTTIDLSKANQNMFVSGGDGIDEVSAGTKNDTLELGGGDDSIIFASSGYLTYLDTIDGGEGDDTITISATSTVTDAVFENITNIEIMDFQGTSTTKTITIGELASDSGLNTLDASTTDGTTLSTGKVIINGGDFTGDIDITTGDGVDTVTIGSGDVNIVTNDGNDLIKVEGSTFDTNDTIDAGDGTLDTVLFTDAVTLTDTMIGQITNAEIIEFSDKSNQSATIGDNADTKNILIYDASALKVNSITMDLSSMTNNKDMTLTGGSANDSFTFKSAHFTVDDIVNGGAGIDSIIFYDTVTTGAGFDDLFADKSKLGVEKIVLSNTGDHTFTIGANAKAAGITEIDAKDLTGVSTIDIDASTFTGNLTITSNGGDDVVIAGSGNDSYILGTGNDAITFKSAALKGDIVYGGSGEDTIYISDLAKIADSSLNNLEGFEKIVLSNTAGTTSIVLSDNAQDSGLKEIDGTAMVDGSTIDTSELSFTTDVAPDPTVIDFTIKTGAGEDKILIGGGDFKVDAADGADTIVIQASNLTKGDEINGGLGNDILEISSSSTSAVAIVDEDFTKITSVETLKLSNFDSQKVTIGTNANNAGIKTIDATGITSGGNDLEIDATALNTAVFTINAGAGADTIKLGTASDTVDGRAGDDTFIFRNADFDVADTVIGNSGTDTILISDAATIVDEDLTNVSTVEVLKLSDFADQSVTLGVETTASLLKELDASGVSDANSVTIDVGYVTSTFYVTGGAGDDTIKITSENLTTKLHIDGGGENVDVDSDDNLIIVDKATITDALLTYFTDIETITLSDYDEQSLELGAKASLVGLHTIDASNLTGTNSVTVDMEDLVSDITFIGGAGSDTVTISMKNTDNNDSIDLGTGTNDILVIGDAINATTTDDDLTDNGGVADGDFDSWLGANGSGLANIESLKLSDLAGQTLVLGANANTLGLNTIDLTDVTKAVTIDATSLANALNITSKSGDHIITTATGAYNDNIESGDGTNTIYLDGGNDTIDTGLKDDTIQIASANLDRNDTLNGGDGTKDTLVVTDLAATNLTDAQFENINNIEVLQLGTDEAGQKVTLGDYARTAGIYKVDATILATTNGFILDASDFYTDNGSAFEVVAGSANDTITGSQQKDYIKAGDGDDIIRYSNDNLKSDDKIDGGDGNDTLIITDKAVLDDKALTLLTSIETLKLEANVTDQVITLGKEALGAGITTLDLSGIDGKNYTVDTSAFTGALEIIVDTSGGTFTTSSKDDTVTIEANMVDEFLSYTGGAGEDTLKINSAATGSTDGISNVIVDNDFSSMVGVERIDLTKGGEVTLGQNALLAGITTVDLSSNTTGASTIDASDFAKSLTVYLGSQADSITTHQTAVVNDFIYTDNGDLADVDAIDLGAGNSDTLIINDAANLTSTQLDGDIAGIEVLKLGNVGDHTVDFTGSASSISLLDGTAMTKYQTSTITVIGKTEDIEVKMGAGDDTIRMTIADLEKYSTEDTTDDNIADSGTSAAQQIINGGAGTDTIMITDAGTITDDLFDDPNLSLLGTLNLTGIEAIGLELGGNITLGIHASVEGITTVDVSNATGGSNINLNAVTKNATVNLGANDDIVTSGGKADTVNVASANLDSNDNISLGNGIDTLNLTTAVNYTDATPFTNITNVEILKLSDDSAGQNVVLTGTYFTQFDAKSLKTGDVTVDVTGRTEKVTVALGSGDDTVKMTFADIDPDTITDLQSINGGKGNDTLFITDTATIEDTDFAAKKIVGFETIKFDGSLTMDANFYSTGITNIIAADAITVDSTAIKKNFDVTGSAAVDTITLGDGADTIRGIDGDDVIISGLGNDTFYFEGDKLDSNDSVDGGDNDALTLGNDGVDTIVFTSTIGTFADSDLAGVTSIEVLEFTDVAGQNFEFGSNAVAAGIISVDASNLTNDFTLTKNADGLVFEGGSGDDTVELAIANLVETDKLIGDDGYDTLLFTDAGTIEDTALTLVKEFEKITLVDGSNTLNLGKYFLYSGITDIDASGVTTNTNTNTIDMSLVTAKKDYNIDGGAGVDTFKMKSAIANYGIDIDGGGETDILEIVDKAVLVDSAFANFANLETIVLGDFTSQTVTLGENARLAGIVTIDGSAMTAGYVTIDTTTMTTDAAVTFTSGDKNDIFAMKVDHVTSADTVTAGAGTDKFILSDGGILADADLANITGIETLSLVEGAVYDITLDTNAMTSGINTFDAITLDAGDDVTLDASTYTIDFVSVKTGSGNDIIKTGSGNDVVYGYAGDDQFTSGSGNDKLYGGYGDDKFTFAAADLDSSDYIKGETGEDTLEITDTATFTSGSTALDNVSYMETLSLLGGGEATFNYHMINSGIREVDGSSSTTALTIDGSYATSKYSLTLEGGSAADKIYAGGGNDTLTGNGDADTFIFSSDEKSNGTNTITDYADGSDLIAISFATGSSDFEETLRVDGAAISASDYDNYIEDVTYDKYDTNGDGTLDGDFALITLNGGDTISLLGISAGIDQTDFVYQLV